MPGIAFCSTGRAASLSAIFRLRQVVPFDSATQVGWTAGGGIEFAFTPNWTAKVEYLYVDFGSLLPGSKLPTASATKRLTHRERRPRRHQLQILVTGLGSEPAIRQSDKRAIQTLLWHSSRC